MQVPSILVDTSCFHKRHTGFLLAVQVALAIFYASFPIHVQSLSPLSASGMTANINIQSCIEFAPTGSGQNFAVTSATASLGWFPKNTLYQNVNNLRIEHTPDESSNPQMLGDIIELRWEHPGNWAQFSLDATVQTKSAFAPVKYKIPFPIDPGSYPHDVDIATYLQSGKIANQSSQISQLARQLVDGKDDLYHAVFSLAEHVSQNIQYSLASEGQPAIQSASAVLRSRRGKCDEITALFVSLNRSLGIPSRFVSGYSYTENDLFDQNWGAHSWAEVYFPGFGWVPFDVTYGQYGYLDAGHIMLSVSHDAETASVEYHASGVDFAMKPGYEMSTVVNPRSISPRENRQTGAIDIKLAAESEEVGFGSDAVVVATVRNNRDHYVAITLDLVRAEETRPLNFDDSSPMKMLMDPREVIDIPFLFHMDGNHQPGFSYEYTFSLSSQWSAREQHVSINVKDGSPVFSARR